MPKTPKGGVSPVLNPLFAALLSSAAIGLPAHADVTLSFGTLIEDARQENYETYGYLARDIVGSINSAGSELARWGDSKLDLQHRSAFARGLYLATAFQGVYRLHWANSIFFGHELVHFSTAHQYGRTEHWFRDDETGEHLSFGEAWLRTFFRMEVGGPAVSGGELDEDEYELSQKEGIRSTAAGVNWQIAYSEAWLRQELTYGEKDMFDVPEFILNRTYLSLYALGDARREAAGDDGSRETGDIVKWVEDLSRRKGVKTTAKEVATWGLAANLISPAYWAGITSISNYITTGEADLSVFHLDTRFGSLTWDVPQYLNLDSMTVVPTAHLTLPSPLAKSFGAGALSFGLGMEVPVVGSDPLEIAATISGTWGRVDADLGLALSETGAFLEGDFDYNIAENVALTLGAAVSEGRTLRGDRNFPFGEFSAWSGLELRF